MFDYSIAHWATFFTAAILLNLSPGPDIAFILGQTVKRGVQSGFSAMFGIWTGAFIHVIFAAMGLSAILATSAVAFSAVKWVGATYLIWLGIQALLSKGTNKSVNCRVSPKGLMKIFKQGVLVAVLNPKVAIFFLAFLPQFVEVGAGPVSTAIIFQQLPTTNGALIFILTLMVVSNSNSPSSLLFFPHI